MKTSVFVTLTTSKIYIKCTTTSTNWFTLKKNRHGTINHTLIKERIFISRVAFKTHINPNVHWVGDILTEIAEIDGHYIRFFPPFDQFCLSHNGHRSLLEVGVKTSLFRGDYFPRTVNLNICSLHIQGFPNFFKRLKINGDFTHLLLLTSSYILWWPWMQLKLVSYD